MRKMWRSSAQKQPFEEKVSIEHYLLKYQVMVGLLRFIIVNAATVGLWRLMLTNWAMVGLVGLWHTW